MTVRLCPCGTIHDSDRINCPDCAPKRTWESKPRESRGYGTEHQQLRAKLLGKFKPGDLCARCGKPMYDRKKIDLDHSDDRLSYLGLSHQLCNRSAGRLTRRQE